jgi:hypothetical protein
VGHAQGRRAGALARQGAPASICWWCRRVMYSMRLNEHTDSCPNYLS